MNDIEEVIKEFALAEIEELAHQVIQSLPSMDEDKRVTECIQTLNKIISIANGSLKGVGHWPKQNFNV